MAVMLLTHNLAVGLLSGVTLTCIPFSRKVAKLLRQWHSYLDGNGDGEACEAVR